MWYSTRLKQIRYINVFGFTVRFGLLKPRKLSFGTWFWGTFGSGGSVLVLDSSVILRINYSWILQQFLILVRKRRKSLIFVTNSTWCCGFLKHTLHHYTGFSTIVTNAAVLIGCRGSFWLVACAAGHPSSFDSCWDGSVRAWSSSSRFDATVLHIWLNSLGRRSCIGALQQLTGWHLWIQFLHVIEVITNSILFIRTIQPT